MRRFVKLRPMAAGLILVTALTGCVPNAQSPRKSPLSHPQSEMGFPPAKPSAASEAVAQHFAQVQASLLSAGLLRSDGGGKDTPFNDRMLAANFLRIAMYDEYTRGASGPVQRESASVLRKWTEPVRVSVSFGASVPADKRATDRARIASFLARLSRITGHPISMSDSAPNFYVHIVNEDERKMLGPTLRASLPGLSEGEVRGITDMPLSTYCLVYAMSQGNSGNYNRAFAVIRSEHPDLMRLSCMHEEISQGLGLANDSPSARPSIFNDDEEFALLTRQDEMMLRMLYSPLLKPGMTEEQARPIVESLAKRMLGGES